MPQGVTTWWTDEKVEETVTSAYIHSHLRVTEQEVLRQPLYYGGDLTDNTYLDWILSRAKRFFLILVATGIPDQIFGVLDDCLDDDDLPIAEEAIPDLRLAAEPDTALDKRFYKTQFRFLTRIIEDGEHIRYADEENVPMVLIGLKSVITSTNKDGVDTVKLPSNSDKVFVRRRVTLDTKLTEEEVLSEIAEMKKFSHEHVISVFGSYLQGNLMSVLLYPAAEYTLKSFLSDTPKSFETLDKTKRRRIMINWPHCLANALAFLHQNGGHHGAIRPSNIHISHQWQISLGHLDGDGMLCSSVKYDDVESYQFAPPERWKRAITVQNTGSGKVALPSGGRSARKADSESHDPLDPSSRRRSGSSTGGTMTALTAYAFLPASKSEFARLRLSTAVDATALIPHAPRRTRHPTSGDTNSTTSRSTNRTPTDRDYRAITRTPSVLSSNSAEGRRRAKTASPQGTFLAAPESRTALVQTWKSVQHDSFAADVFSLAAVIMEILTVLCKKTCGAFARHRSAKNRNAGRGGGLADASFHANLGQVLSWAQLLADEAQKKVTKDESQVLSAVGAILQVIIQCLERSPEARLKSSALEVGVGELIKKFAQVDPLHCTFIPVEQPAAPTPSKLILEPCLISSSAHRFNRSPSRPRQESIPEHTELGSRPSPSMSTARRPVTSRTMMPTVSLPAVSLRSMPSVSLDLDGRSERSERSGTVVGSTVVGSFTPFGDQSMHTSQHRPDLETTDREIEAWAASDYSPHKPGRFQYAHANDSDVDPRLRISMDNSEEGVFTYMNYSTSPSDDEEPSQFMYPMPPPNRPPNRDLPPVPPKPQANTSRSQAPQGALPLRKKQVKSTPPGNPRGPTRDEIHKLQTLSRSIPSSRHPMRMSSLCPGQGEKQEEEEELHPPQDLHLPRSLSPHKAHGDRQRDRVYRTRA